ncbi:MAG: hypothetical protein AAGA40_14525 [Cyanobacteria bacterium P01_E01_bin.45]
MTRYYHFVNGMEMAVLAEATHQLHAAGYASTLDLVYSVAKQALDRLPPLYFSIKPLSQSPITQALSGKRQSGNSGLGAAGMSQADEGSQSANPLQSPSKHNRAAAIPKLLKTSGQTTQVPSNRALTQEQKRQMQAAVQQAIQAMMKRQHRDQLPHEQWFAPIPWSEMNNSDMSNGLPTNCYYG